MVFKYITTFDTDTNPRGIIRSRMKERGTHCRTGNCKESQVYQQSAKEQTSVNKT